MVVPIFSAILFEWDAGNREKNWIKHKVSIEECEQIFFNEPLLMFDDVRHSQEEERWYALGKTKVERFLYVAFTMRTNRIRIISARNMDAFERKNYAQAEKNSNL